MEAQHAALVHAFCLFPALPLIPQSVGHVKGRIRGGPSPRVSSARGQVGLDLAENVDVLTTSNPTQSHLKLKGKGMQWLALAGDTTSLTPCLLGGKVRISPLIGVKEQGTGKPTGNR